MRTVLIRSGASAYCSKTPTYSRRGPLVEVQQPALEPAILDPPPMPAPRPPFRTARAGILAAVGMKARVTHVSWSDNPITGNGGDDWRNRKVEVRVIPGK